MRTQTSKKIFFFCFFSLFLLSIIGKFCILTARQKFPTPVFPVVSKFEPNDFLFAPSIQNPRSPCRVPTSKLLCSLYQPGVQIPSPPCPGHRKSSTSRFDSLCAVCSGTMSTPTKTSRSNTVTVKGAVVPVLKTASPRKFKETCTRHALLDHLRTGQPMHSIEWN